MNIAFHIGLHKTATTWLQSVYFNQHPEICLLNDYNSPWDDELIKYLVLNDINDFSSKVFIEMVTKRISDMGMESFHGVYLISAERLSGHPYSGGFDRLTIANNIYKSYPKAKIFIFFRNQTGIIESTYQQLVKEGYLGTLKELLDENCWKRPCFKKSYFDYQKIVQLYIALFGNDNFKFYLFENLTTNKKKLVSDMCNFLDIAVMEIKNEKKVNKAESYKRVRAMRILNHFRKTDYNLYPLINLTSKRTYNLFVKIVSVFYTEKQIKLNDKDDIYQYYLKSNQELLGLHLDKQILHKYLGELND